MRGMLLLTATLPHDGGLLVSSAALPQSAANSDLSDYYKELVIALARKSPMGDFTKINFRSEVV